VTVCLPQLKCGVHETIRLPKIRIHQGGQEGEEKIRWEVMRYQNIKLTLRLKTLFSTIYRDRILQTGAFIGQIDQSGPCESEKFLSYHLRSRPRRPRIQDLFPAHRNFVLDQRPEPKNQSMSPKERDALGGKCPRVQTKTQNHSPSRNLMGIQNLDHIEKKPDIGQLGATPRGKITQGPRIQYILLTMGSYNMYFHRHAPPSSSLHQLIGK
jgi:hypothetical protein